MTFDFIEILAWMILLLMDCLSKEDSSICKVIQHIFSEHGYKLVLIVHLQLLVNCNECRYVFREASS